VHARRCPATKGTFYLITGKGNEISNALPKKQGEESAFFFFFLYVTSSSLLFDSMSNEILLILFLQLCENEIGFF